MLKIFPDGFYHRSFVLGHYYKCCNIYGLNVFQFIKVTRKGFNLLNIITHRCLFERHLYSRKWANKEIPNHIKNIEYLSVRDRYMFNEIKNEKIIINYLNNAGWSKK